MTSNANWREIIENLGPGQAACDRPDLVARVFHAKLRSLLHDLRANSFFGKVIAYTWVVEYQKRGLPHAHILLILDQPWRPVTPTDIDSMVSAELPDPYLQPRLWATVTSCMLHGPCGVAHPNCPCMVSGRCKSGYPRAYQETTSMGEDGYPMYRRRHDGRTYVNNGFVFDNQRVVPYSPLLCLKYDCHLNVEIASAISAVKYLFKYVYKGNDRAAFVLHEADEDVNEIKNYLDGRYISPAEACYRLFSYNISEHGPSVSRLPIHLPGDKTVMFRPTADARATLRSVKPSKLEAFFSYCRLHPGETANLLYPDCPGVLTWDEANGNWKKRQRNAAKSIGRVGFVPSGQGEVSNG